MVSYESLLMDFVKDKFGSSIGETLLHSELKLYRIKSLGQLEQKDQMMFAERFLNRKFGKFMAPEDVKLRIMQLNLQYCAMKATERISSKLNQKTTIAPFDIQFDDIYNSMSKLKALANISVCYPVHISEGIDADILFFMKNQDALEVARTMSYVNGKSSSEEIGDPNNNALLNDFITLLVPTILESVSTLLGKRVSFSGTKPSLINNPDGVEKMLLGESKESKKIFISEIPLILNDKKLNFTVVMSLG
jgi:chemotaxis protein CheY-P-specific phosphatase CheC